MKLLALFVAFFILLFIIFFLRIYLELSYSFRNYESKLNLEIRILFLKFKINFNIPKELLVKGYNNIVQNFINDLSEHEEQIKSDPETTNSVNAKSRRYRTLKFSMRESFRHYMASWLNIVTIVRQLTKIKNYFYHKLNIYSLQIVLEVGGRDAAETGILTGVIWGFLGQMTARMHRRFTIKKKGIHYSVLPNFQDTIFSLQLQGILSLKISHIIFTVYKLLVFVRKRRLKK